MFIHTSQIDQQFAISRLRAIETHRYVVVAAINGITGVIAPDGSVVASVPTRTQAYVDSPVGLFDTVTPAVRIGPWLGRACAGLVVLGWLLALRPVSSEPPDPGDPRAPSTRGRRDDRPRCRRPHRQDARMTPPSPTPDRRRSGGS